MHMSNLSSIRLPAEGTAARLVASMVMPFRPREDTAFQFPMKSLRNSCIVAFRLLPYDDGWHRRR